MYIYNVSIQSWLVGFVGILNEGGRIFRKLFAEKIEHKERARERMREI